jgi:hypothetical protein
MGIARVRGSRFKTGVKIKDLPHRKLRHLAASPVVLSSDTIVLVSASVPCGWDRAHADLCSSPSSDVGVDDTGERESERMEASRGMCGYRSGVGFPLTCTSCEESPGGHDT